MSDDQEAWPLLQAADRLANEVLRPLLGERSMVAIPAARAVVDALRADPEFAAAVLGGQVQRRRIDRDGALVGEYLAKIDGDRDEMRPVGPWTETP